MIVFGIDASYRRTGWAVMDGGKLIDYGSIKPPSRYDKVTFKDPLFSEYLHWYSKTIEFLVADANPSVVAMEDINIRFLASGKVLQQMQAAAKIGVINTNICKLIKNFTGIMLIHNTTIKSQLGIIYRKKDLPKKIVEKAKECKIPAVKLQMIDIVNSEFGINLGYWQQDEADAIGICMVARKKALKL